MATMRCLAAAAAVAALAAAVAGYSDYDAAKCVSEGGGCSGWRAEKAKHWCRAGRSPHDQDPCCKHKACEWCRSHSYTGFCHSGEIKGVCGNGWGNYHQCQQGHTTNNNNNNGGGNGGSSNGGHYLQQSRSGGGGCVWKMGYGKNNLVINPSGSAQGQWQESWNGITYKPGDYNPHQIDGQGSSAITYRFQVNQGGSYYVTARSTAAAHTEHNDVWLKCNAGLKLVSMAHRGTSGYNYGYIKAYQNEFSGSMTLYSKDHDPHQIVTGHLNPGQTYELTISGRSTRFKIERLVLVRCQGGCMKYEQSMQSAIGDMSVSQCS